MKDQVRKLKFDLKEIAKQIRSQKKFRKLRHPHHDKYIGDYPLLSLREAFRHKHVAYCLARGRTLEQVDTGVRLDMDRVDWILRTMGSESKEKLYVVVNSELPCAQQAVQSAHAVAEFLRKNPYTMWSNGHLILLKDKPYSTGNLRRGYSPGGYEWAEFLEPDFGNKITAYACFGPNVETVLKYLKLV